MKSESLTSSSQSVKKKDRPFQLASFRARVCQILFQITLCVRHTAVRSYREPFTVIPPPHRVFLYISLSRCKPLFPHLPHSVLYTNYEVLIAQ